MPNNVIDGQVVCPYYVRETKQSIICEGIIDKSNVSRFETRQKKIEHLKNFCMCNCYLGCGVCIAITENYK